MRGPAESGGHGFTVTLICSDLCSSFILLPPPSLLIDMLRETYSSLFPLFPPRLPAPFCPLPFPCPRPHGRSYELLFLQNLQFPCNVLLYPQWKVPSLYEAQIYTWNTKENCNQIDWHNHSVGGTNLIWQNPEYLPTVSSSLASDSSLSPQS